MRDHRKLEVFTLADELALSVYAVTREFPDDERYGLTSQIRRAAVSVGANIVEGAARPTENDFVRFLTIAYGSACELEYEISLACRLNYVPPEHLTALQDQSSRLCRALRKFIEAIRG
jgi:four helix bundle protein